MSVSAFVALLFTAAIGLAWLMLEAMLHCKFSQIEKFTAAAVSKHGNPETSAVLPTNHSLGIKSVSSPASDARL